MVTKGENPAGRALKADEKNSNRGEGKIREPSKTMHPLSCRGMIANTEGRGERKRKAARWCIPRRHPAEERGHEPTKKGLFKKRSLSAAIPVLSTDIGANEPSGAALACCGGGASRAGTNEKTGESPLQHRRRVNCRANPKRHPRACRKENSKKTGQKKQERRGTKSRRDGPKKRDISQVTRELRNDENIRLSEKKNCRKKKEPRARPDFLRQPPGAVNLRTRNQQ